MSKPFGEMIRERRLDSGFTGVRLAELSGVAQSHLSRVELSRQLPTEAVARSLMEALNMSIRMQNSALRELDRERESWTPDGGATGPAGVSSTSVTTAIADDIRLTERDKRILHGMYRLMVRL